MMQLESTPQTSKATVSLKDGQKSEVVAFRHFFDQP